MNLYLSMQPLSLSSLKAWVRFPPLVICNKTGLSVTCEMLVTYSVYCSTYKTNCYEITEILLKVSIYIFISSFWEWLVIILIIFFIIFIEVWYQPLYTDNYLCVVRLYDTTDSMVQCTRMLFQSIFAVIFFI
jgi:hypothetical protein